MHAWLGLLTVVPLLSLREEHAQFSSLVQKDNRHVEKGPAYLTNYSQPLVLNESQWDQQNAYPSLT